MAKKGDFKWNMRKLRENMDKMIEFTLLGGSVHFNYPNIEDDEETVELIDLNELLKEEFVYDVRGNSEVPAKDVAQHVNYFLNSLIFQDPTNITYRELVKEVSAKDNVLNLYIIPSFFSRAVEFYVHVAAFVRAYIPTYVGKHCYLYHKVRIHPYEPEEPQEPGA